MCNSSSSATGTPASSWRIRIGLISPFALGGVNSPLPVANRFLSCVVHSFVLGDLGNPEQGFRGERRQAGIYHFAMQSGECAPDPRPRLNHVTQDSRPFSRPPFPPRVSPAAMA